MKWIIVSMFLLTGWAAASQPIDDLVERKTLSERKALKYAPLRESDIFWQKRIWRVIDVREKINQPFVYPQAPLFSLLVDAADAGHISLYSGEDDKFSYLLNATEIHQTLYQVDTIEISDPQTYEISYVPVENELFYEDVKRFRLKEIWFFDENTSSLHVRIIGIAPLIEVRDEFGNFRYEKPLFWIYYPELREVMARWQVFMPGNESHAVSWEDVFERRQFASTIVKTNNVLDLRLQDRYTGLDALWEADKIRQELFNYEHDLWSY